MIGIERLGGLSAGVGAGESGVMDKSAGILLSGVRGVRDEERKGEGGRRGEIWFGGMGELKRGWIIV